MNESQLFLQMFNEKKFDEAREAFEQLSNVKKEAILAQLFQASQSSRMPQSASVLFRRLHEGKEFSDFYSAWFPPKEKCKPEVVDGYTYQNFFDGPIRVINAINIQDPNEIVSIGLHWISDEDLKAALSDPDIEKKGEERGDRISEVAKKEKADIYKVLKDDNLGTAF